MSKKQSICIFVSAVLISIIPAFAQESPLPGNSTPVSSNTQSNDTGVSTAPIPGLSNAPSRGEISPPVNLPNMGIPDIADLPVSLTALQASIDELKNNDPTEERLNRYLTQLDGLIKAHYKLALVFSKQEAMTSMSISERYLSKQLSLLKDKVLYLKAQVLIKENRLSEAVNLLVDIVAMEPLSPLGQQAYTRLIETGFSVKPQAVSLSTQAAKASAKSK